MRIYIKDGCEEAFWETVKNLHWNPYLYYRGYGHSVYTFTVYTPTIDSYRLLREDIYFYIKIRGYMAEMS